jgi:diguanylate cyclase (GGDEF)-like protein
MLLDGAAVDGFAARLATIGGKGFWGLISGRTTVLDDENVVIGGIADLTTQKEVEQRLRELATLDALTGVFNRRYFFEAADATLTVADRHGKIACLAMLDIDHFKKINDEHGHLVGDEVLRRVTRASRDAIRASDVLARYGGEELVLLLPEAELDAAERIVERIRSAVADETLATESGPVSVTLSAGLAAREQGELLEKLIRRADSALYAAKHAGRNRVVVSRSA